MPTILSLLPDFTRLPPGDGLHRALRLTSDKIESQGLDLSRALGTDQKGLVWAGVSEGEPIDHSKRMRGARERATVVQVTNLGITVKDSPQNTLVFVTRLDTGAPVPGAHVSLIDRSNTVRWEETTGSDGAVIAPGSPRSKFWDFEFIVVAEKDGDIAYLGSDWHEGIGPYDFGYGLNLREAQPILRGSVFTDRGVYRLGEEVHLKTILRSDTPTGVKLLAPGTIVDITTRDSQNKEIDKRTRQGRRLEQCRMDAHTPGGWCTRKLSDHGEAAGRVEQARQRSRSVLRLRARAKRDRHLPRCGLSSSRFSR